MRLKTGSWPYLILLAKSARRTIDVRHEPESRSCERTNSRETDFASSIIFGEVESTGTSARKTERLLLRKSAVFPTLSWTRTRGKTSKPPRFTKSAQEPNGMKLSSNTLLYQGFACLSAWSGSPQASWGQRVTAWGSIYFD
jgi:hypothetical protein